MKMDKIWISAMIVALAASFAAPLMAQDEACGRQGTLLPIFLKFRLLTVIQN